MTQFIKRKSKAIIKFKVDDLDEKDTTIKLNNINLPKGNHKILLVVKDDLSRIGIREVSLRVE